MKEWLEIIYELGWRMIMYGLLFTGLYNAFMTLVVIIKHTN